MELKDVGQKDAEMHYGVGDDDVDGNDDRFDGDGVEINLIEMLNLFSQYCYFSAVVFFRPSPLGNMAHIAFYWATLQTAFSTNYIN